MAADSEARKPQKRPVGLSEVRNGWKTAVAGIARGVPGWSASTLGCAFGGRKASEAPRECPVAPAVGVWPKHWTLWEGRQMGENTSPTRARNPAVSVS